MEVCAENVFITPAMEAINVIQSTAEEQDRAASSDPHHGHQETDAEQETEARGFSPAHSSESGGTSGSCSGGALRLSTPPRGAPTRPPTPTSAPRRLAAQAVQANIPTPTPSTTSPTPNAHLA